jgi:hypothetical protein
MLHDNRDYYIPPKKVSTTKCLRPTDFVLHSAAMKLKLSKAVKAAFREAGAAGGRKRARRMTREQRVAQAKHAAAVRWGKQ